MHALWRVFLFTKMAPKAQIKPEKQEKTKLLADTLKSAKSVVFIDYTGMDVSSMAGLRDALATTGARVSVAKNTLIKVAGKEAGIDEAALSDEVLTGQTAYVYSTEDAITPIQILGKFAKTTELAKIKAGIVEGVFHGKDGIIAISKLPSKEQLQANVVGAIAGPMYGIVGTLNAGMQKLVFIVDQYRLKKS